METIENLIDSLPKRDVSIAKSLLKKRDIQNLSYLCWADYVRVKSSPKDYPSINLANVEALYKEIDKLKFK